MKLIIPPGPDQSDFMVLDDSGNDITSLFHGTTRIRIDMEPCQPSRVTFEMTSAGCKVEVLQQHANVVMRPTSEQVEEARQALLDNVNREINRALYFGKKEPAPIPMKRCPSCRGEGTVSYGGDLNPTLNPCEVCSGLGLIEGKEKA